MGSIVSRRQNAVGIDFREYATYLRRSGSRLKANKYRHCRMAPAGMCLLRSMGRSAPTMHETAMHRPLLMKPAASHEQS
jgi:hypothetical protein